MSFGGGHCKYNLATSDKEVKFQLPGNNETVKLMATFDTVCQPPVVSPPSSNTTSANNINKRSTSPTRNRNETNHQTHVNFESGRNVDKAGRQKYFTAKYGQHQMMLIRKRLAIEDWIYDELRMLYNCHTDEDDHSSPFDLEELLDLETDDERRLYSQESLSDARQPSEVINKFIDEAVEKARSLW